MPVKKLTSLASWSWDGKMEQKMMLSLVDVILRMTGKDSMMGEEVGMNQRVRLYVTVEPLPDEKKEERKEG